jgi:hypothetical protein
MVYEFQNKLLELIVAQYDRKADAIDAMAVHLNISRDTMYRRIRNDSYLSLEESIKLSQVYNISLDALHKEGTPNVFFTFNAFQNEIKTYEDYLNYLVGSLKAALTIKNIRGYYASSEIPVFYYCVFPELFYFKLYVWGITIWRMKGLKEVPFGSEIIPETMIQKSKELISLYSQLDTTELWSIGIFDNTRNQIEYFVKSGYIKDPEIALRLLNNLTDLADTMEKMVLNSNKLFSGVDQDGNPNKIGDFKLFQNEMIFTNNTIIMVGDSFRTIFSTFASPNYIVSQDARLCDYAMDWYENIKANCNNLNTSGGKVRSEFFNHLKNRVQMTKNRVLSLVEETKIIDK